MSEKTCETCRYKHDRAYEAPNKFYVCTRILADVPEETEKYVPNAFISGEPDRDGLMVNDSFGCNLWEPKS